ncbi:MAG: hypothetical protein PHH11_00765 [Methylomonas sp.]|nr:hypothetical protein [Methylomonas sp.]
MKRLSLKKTLTVAIAMLAVGLAQTTWAHSGGGVIDAEGVNASATDLAAVTCSDDGNGAPHYLMAQIKDTSEYVPGLLLSVHIYKGNKMTTSTDTVPGDAEYSPEVALYGGTGVYYLSITKTNAGSRSFDVIWHCMTAEGLHTGTDIAVVQFQ